MPAVEITNCSTHSYTQKQKSLIFVQFPFKQTKPDRSWAFLSI